MSDLTLKDKLIPWYFVLFFVIIALVDGVMVTLAIRTHSGLVTEHAYEKGIAYNQVISAKNSQDELGWKADILWDGKKLDVKLHDKQNAVLTPAKIKAYFTRPTTSNMDFEVDILQSAGRVDFPANGVWDARLFITCQGKEYQQTKRLVVEWVP